MTKPLVGTAIQMLLLMKTTCALTKQANKFLQLSDSSRWATKVGGLCDTVQAFLHIDEADVQPGQRAVADQAGQKTPLRRQVRIQRLRYETLAAIVSEVNA